MMANNPHKDVSSLKRQRHENDVISHSESKYQKSGSLSKVTFKTGPRDLFNKKFPYFRMPEEYGSFSQDSDRQFHCDKTQMRFYVPPLDMKSVEFDLSVGYSDMIRKDENKKEYLDDMIRWIMENSAKFQLQTAKVKDAHQENNQQHKVTSCDDIFSESTGPMKLKLGMRVPTNEETLKVYCTIKILHTDFVCWRGLMTRLLCTPYENRDGWIIAVTLYKGTYYLCEFETEEKKRQKETTTPRQDEMCCWGWKFEQYLTASVPGGKPDTSVPVNNNEGFCSVVRTRLNKHSLVFGGEVDCVDPTLSSKNKYVELKTTREMDTPRQKENYYRYKLIKWWAQSFLIGIDQIVCGLRDDDGIVHRLEEFHTGKIPDMVKNIRDPWSAAVCFNFLDKFLDFIKQTVTTDDASVVYVWRWSPRQDITCEKMSPGSEFVFLPDWFINWEAWG